MDITTRN